MECEQTTCSLSTFPRAHSRPRIRLPKPRRTDLAPCHPSDFSQSKTPLEPIRVHVHLVRPPKPVSPSAPSFTSSSSSIPSSSLVSATSAVSSCHAESDVANEAGKRPMRDDIPIDRSAEGRPQQCLDSNVFFCARIRNGKALTLRHLEMRHCTGTSGMRSVDRQVFVPHHDLPPPHQLPMPFHFGSSLSNDILIELVSDEALARLERVFREHPAAFAFPHLSLERVSIEQVICHVFPSMADRLEGLDVIPVEFDETMHDLRCQQGVAERERTYARLASLVSRFPWNRPECLSPQTGMRIHGMLSSTIGQLIHEQPYLPSVLCLHRYLSNGFLRCGAFTPHHSLSLNWQPPCFSAAHLPLPPPPVSQRAPRLPHGVSAAMAAPQHSPPNSHARIAIGGPPVVDGVHLPPFGRDANLPRHLHSSPDLRRSLPVPMGMPGPAAHQH